MQKTQRVITLGVIDHNTLLSIPFSNHLHNQEGLTVSFSVSDGETAFNQPPALLKDTDMLLVETASNEGRMPVLAIAERVREEHPHIQLVGLCSSFHVPLSARLTQLGCKAFLSKGMDIDLFVGALMELHQMGYTSANLALEHSVALRQFTHEKLHIELTYEEKRYLELICENYSHAAIARELCVSIHTVNRYTQRIQDKFGVKAHRLVLAIMAMQWGLIEIRAMV